MKIIEYFVNKKIRDQKKYIRILEKKIQRQRNGISQMQNNWFDEIQSHHTCRERCIKLQKEVMRIKTLMNKAYGSI